MRTTLARAIAGPLALILSFATAPLVCAQQQNSTTPNNAQPAAQNAPQQSTPSNHQPPVELPENPGQGGASQPGQNSSQPSPTQQEQRPEPSGTAVAPQVETSGGAASRPAGVAIAPPKQRRVHSLLIKLGVLAGAGVAIGTVAALSAASPGHVPNSPGH